MQRHFAILRHDFIDYFQWLTVRARTATTVAATERAPLSSSRPLLPLVSGPINSLA